MKKEQTPTVYWSLLSLQKDTIYVAATDKGVVFIGSLNEKFQEVENWVEKHIPNATVLQDDEKLTPICSELIEYFEGKRTHMTIPIDEKGTPFQLNVWKALRDIPYGETKTYSDIAESIGNPKAVRAVGRAIGANPILISNPCHRVIGKNGKLTGFRGGLEMKKILLQLESNKEVKTHSI